MRAEALEILQGHDHGPLYTPPSEKGTVLLRLQRIAQSASVLVVSTHFQWNSATDRILAEVYELTEAERHVVRLLVEEVAGRDAQPTPVGAHVELVGVVLEDVLLFEAVFYGGPQFAVYRRGADTAI